MKPIIRAITRAMVVILLLPLLLISVQCTSDSSGRAAKNAPAEDDPSIDPNTVPVDTDPEPVDPNPEPVNPNPEPVNPNPVPVDTVPPQKIEELAAQPALRSITLSWRNPSDADLQQVEIAYRKQGGTQSETVMITVPVVASTPMQKTVTPLEQTTAYQFSLTAMDQSGNRGEAVPIVSQTIENLEERPFGVDEDEDGLIAIYSIEELNAIRYDLNGDGLLDEGAVVPPGEQEPPGQDGCPQSGCIGYELMVDLDFNTDGSEATEENLAAASEDDTYWNDRTGWAPIGRYYYNADDQPYTAIFEGNNHTIHNFYTNRYWSRQSGEKANMAGLFGYLAGEQAEIRNLHLRNGYVVAVPPVDSGTLVGLNKGSISHSSFQGVVRVRGVTVNLASFGGLVGKNEGRIDSSFAAGRLDFLSEIETERGLYSDVGGLAGSNKGTIVNSYAANHITVEKAHGHVGGLVGSNFKEIRNSFASGDVSVRYAITGGLVGRNKEGRLEATYASGTVEANTIIGGLVGQNHFGYIEESYVSSSVQLPLVAHDLGNGVYVYTTPVIHDDIPFGIIAGINQAGLKSTGIFGADLLGGIINSYYWSDNSAHTLAIDVGNDHWTANGHPNYQNFAGFPANQLKAASGPGAVLSDPYYLWSIDNWDFGNDQQFPALRSYKLDNSGNQIEGDLLCGQPTDRQQCSDS